MSFWIGLGWLGVGLVGLYVLGCVVFRLVHPRGYVSPPPAFTQKSYALLRTVDEILTRRAIPYWLEAGTLLGALRHGGMIPWDDDLDVVIPETYAALLEQASADLCARGLKLFPYSFGKKVGYLADPYQADYAPTPLEYLVRFFCRSHYPYIDIFFMRETGHELRYSSAEWAARVPHLALIYKAETFPLQRHRFGPIEVNSPHAAEAYLRRAFGNWREGRVTLGHHIPRYYHVFNLLMRRVIPASELTASPLPGEINDS